MFGILPVGSSPKKGRLPAWLPRKTCISNALVIYLSSAHLLDTKAKAKTERKNEGESKVEFMWGCGRVIALGRKRTTQAELAERVLDPWATF